MLNWLMIGVGDIARKRVLPALLAEPRSRLAGIVTRSPEKAEPYGAPAWRDLETALAQCPAEAVYVATPVALHAPQTIACLRAGRHVLCEKPMSVDYAGACSMERAARETGRLLGIAYYRRFYPKVNRARDLIAAGAIGRPFLAEATLHEWREPGPDRGWLFDPAMSGGGPLWDVACHRIDAMNYLFGSPARACGRLSTLVHATEVEDNATAMTDYKSGVRGIVDVRWHSRVSRDEFRIRGTEGEIELTPLNGPRLVYPGGEESLPPHANLHYPCIEDFVSAALEGSPLRSSGATALETDWAIGQVARNCWRVGSIAKG